VLIYKGDLSANPYKYTADAGMGYEIGRVRHRPAAVNFGQTAPALFKRGPEGFYAFPGDLSLAADLKAKFPKLGLAGGKIDTAGYGSQGYDRGHLAPLSIIAFSSSSNANGQFSS
jgi:hypothetical protein